MMKYIFAIILFCLPFVLVPVLEAQNNEEFKIARIQYRGGGDWYSSPTALTNMLNYLKEEVPVRVSSRYDDVQLGSRDIFNYPFLFMTGHGNITVNDAEMENLRSYLENGGFLYVDDDYGFDQYVRPILENIFPEEEFLNCRPIIPSTTSYMNFRKAVRPKCTSTTEILRRRLPSTEMGEWCYSTPTNPIPPTAGPTTNTQTPMKLSRPLFVLV